MALVVWTGACSSSERDEDERTGQSRAGLTTAIAAIADTYVKAGTPNQNQGTQTTLRLQALGNNRALVRFDTAALASFVEGTAVTLRLTIADNAENWGPNGRPIAVHRLTKSWSELGATWNCAIDSNTSNIFADCSGSTAWEMSSPLHPELRPWVSIPTATATITNGQFGNVTFDVSADVAAFRSGTPNYGWLIKKQDELPPGRVEFASRETTTPPVLVGTCADTDDSGTCHPSDGGDGGNAEGGVGSDAGGSSDSGSGIDTGVGEDAGDGGPACISGHCDDGNECTQDECTLTGCVHTPVTDGTTCSDSNACTLGDQCSSGVCLAGAPVDPNDSNPCTIDSCDAVLGIFHVPAAAATPCPNATVCDGDETCDGAGVCTSGTPPVVDDGNPCTDDACEATAGVTHTPRPAGDPVCSDADACNGMETCNGTGSCAAGTPPSLDDQNVCTTDSCSPITGPVHTPIPGCDPTPTRGGAPFETRASIMGKLVAGTTPIAAATFTVTDAPLSGASANPPRGDVSASIAADGSFRLRLTTFPDVEEDRSPPKHVTLKIESSAYLPVHRDVWLHTGDAVDLGIVHFAARDSAVTNIGPEGGTASDSQNRIQIVVPAGALTTTVPIRITPIPARDEMPAPLPDNTPTQYGFELEPSGTTFAQPITVRLANWRSLPTTFALPTGVYDVVNGRWDHDAQATWDGSRFAFQTDHFSLFDCNASRPRSPDIASLPGDGPDNGPLACVGSACDLSGGSLHQDFSLPTYRVKDEDFGVALAYSSGLAAGRALGTAPANYDAVSHAGFAVALRGERLEARCVPGAAAAGTPTFAEPGRCVPQGINSCTLGNQTPVPLTITRSIAGASMTSSVTMGLANKQVEHDGFLNLAQLSPTATAGAGLYRSRMVVRAQTPGSCLAPSTTFGATDERATGTQTSLEDGPLATIDSHVFIPHRLTSPFGAGWSLRDISRIYAHGDVAHRFGGDGRVEVFRPRVRPRTLTAEGNGVVLARDEQTGEIFLARDSGAIERVDAVTGNVTPVLSSLWTTTEVHGLAVAYVGATRHFVVALGTKLVDVDGAGAQRTISTRTSNPAFAQSQVAARGDVVFYTDALSPVLFRALLSDPMPSLTAATLSTGGDVRIHPRASLSGVQLTRPRGLAFTSDGALLVTDIGRNVVYAVHPSTGGLILPTSRVDVAVGDGSSITAAPLGERSPGEQFRIREPLGLSVGEDGLVVIATTYGMALYDPLAREAEWLTFFGGLDEITFAPTALRVSILALSDGSALSRNDNMFVTTAFNLARFDTDRLSSEWDPTRTMRRLTGGGVELVDTTSAMVERFDSAGRLVEKRKRTGEVVITASYADASSDRVASLTDAVGGQTLFEYDGSGKIQRITDARGRQTTFTVDVFGDLVSMTQPGLESHAFTYSGHRMTEKRSPRGDLTSYAYRADGTMQSATRPEGAVTTVDPTLSHPPVFNAQGQIERRGSFTNDHGIVHDIVINRRGEIETDTCVEGGVTRVVSAQYYTASDLSDVVSANGHLFNVDPLSRRKNRLLLVTNRLENGVSLDVPFVFDAHGRKIIQLRNSGASNIHRWTYDADDWLVEEYSGGSGPRWSQRYERDVAGHVTRAFDISPGSPQFPTGKEQRWTYRPDGLVATSTEHGVVRTFAYDDVGGTKNGLGWTDTMGRSLTMTRDSSGNVATSSDGTATTFADFDARNRLIRSRDALGHETVYGYSHAGCACSEDSLVTSIHTPDLPAGTNWEMSYDHEGRLSSVTDPDGFTETYGYEASGELKEVLDKLSRSTRWNHDGFGRVSSMIDTLGRHHAHAHAVPTAGTWTGPTLMAGSSDATTTSTSLTGALRSGDYQIGHNAYPIDGYPAQISLYRDATFELGYSLEFDLAKRINLRRDRTALAIDSTVIPTGASTVQNETWSYFASSSTSPVLQNYSSLRTGTSGNSGFFLTRNIEEDVTQTEGYNYGNPYVIEFYVRDVAGRPTTLTRRFLTTFSGVSVTPPPDKVSTYTYRPDGRFARIVNPDGTHDFTYNSRGLVETQTVSGEGAYMFGYDEMSRNDYLEYPDGHVRRQQYDNLGRIASRCYEYPGPTVRCYTSQYDAVGNPVRMADPDGADVLEYDALDRLKKVTREVGGVAVAVEDYAYNALGALKLNAGVVLDDQRPRLAGGGTADAAVPATIGGQAITLDNGGRITSLRGVGFTYDTPSILQGATPPVPALPISFGLDSDMRRISEVQGSNGEFYYYEGLDRITTILAGAGGVKETYLFDGIDHPLRIKQGSTTAYYELDLAGNVRGLRLSGGAVLGSYRYTAFGKTVEDTATINQPLRWKGRWHQNLGGIEIYDVRARQWAPELGVFLSIDEYRYHQHNTTLWAWPRQNPVQEMDPFGRGPIDLLSCWWKTGNFAQCWQEEGDRAESACRKNPNGCQALGGVPGRGGPFSGNESAIRKACRAEGDIAYQECMRQNFESFFPTWACRNARKDGEKKCLEKAGLEPLRDDNPSGLPCAPLPMPIPAVP